MPTLSPQATHSPILRFAVSPFFWSEARIRYDLIPAYGPLHRIPLCASRATSSHSIDEVVATLALPPVEDFGLPLAEVARQLEVTSSAIYKAVQKWDTKKFQ